MDTLRGNFDSSDVTDDSRDYDVTEDESVRDVPPAAIGQDERRMQVRAYNFWAGMLDDRNYPSIEELNPENIEDFGPYSVLLDFSVGIDDPAVQFLGKELAKECGTEDEIRKLSDVPPRSLLSRITDHYMQILANQAPIGFEAEFVNQRGNTVLYRGILLPYSSDDETIDFIYGVINWKEMADAVAADELLLEIDQALEQDEQNADEDRRESDPVTDWADGPVGEDESDNVVPELASGFGDQGNVSPLDLSELDLSDDDIIGSDEELPQPAFGDYSLDDDYEDEEEEEANYDFASLTDHIKAPVKKAPALDLEGMEAQVHYEPESFGTSQGDLDETPSQHDIPVAYEPENPIPAEEDYANEPAYQPHVPATPDVSVPEAAENDSSIPAVPEPVFYEPEHDPEPEAVEPVSAAPVTPEPMVPNVPPLTALAKELPEGAGLYDCLASARELALAARTSEDRSRSALYAAVGRAYDFSLAAEEAPEEYEELIEENGLAAQERAPMTPVVKLVFGADYDKTRLTEYAAVLSHAHRVGIERGKLSDFLSEAEGGLKGVVQAERRLRKEESGKTVEPTDAVRSALAKKLRKIDAIGLDELDTEGAEFSLVMVRRTEDGEIVVLGEIDDDIPLIERVGRILVK
ncbi:PAS domain-containing protein [Altererythrobacter sp.]|uniref:PAS domain-containing protein n=1 Tax=Altererythrobacter sp. TaxID=1872480 RepID=UPI003D117809